MRGRFVGLGSLPMWRPNPILSFRVFQTEKQPSADTVREKREKKIKERESFAQQLPAATEALFIVGSG